MHNLIMDTHESDSKVFFNIMKRQSSTRTSQTQVLSLDGYLLSNSKDVAHGFALHFEKLATRTSNDMYDENYQELVSFDRLLIEDIFSSRSSTCPNVTATEVSKIVKSFKNNKAQDMRGLAAEHLKFSPDIVFSYLAQILNYILQTGYVPKQLKEGVLTPVLKKDKDPSLPISYRGITVLSILGKLLEKVILKRSDPILSINQSRLQRGFTRNSSSVNAALIITETQNEVVDLREDLYLVALDAAKAFDVVWQDSLMRKIYNAGVDGSLWLTTANLYRDAETSVKWSSHVSEPFKVQQGVCQGGVLSAQHCKLYNNDLLHMIVNLQIGTTIGHINCSAPTCCDDLAALARRALFLQMIMNIVEFYKNGEREIRYPDNQVLQSSFSSQHGI